MSGKAFGCTDVGVGPFSRGQGNGGLIAPPASGLLRLFGNGYRRDGVTTAPPDLTMNTSVWRDHRRRRRARPSPAKPRSAAVPGVGTMWRGVLGTVLISAYLTVNRLRPGAITS